VLTGCEGFVARFRAGQEICRPGVVLGSHPSDDVGVAPAGFGQERFAHRDVVLPKGPFLVRAAFSEASQQSKLVIVERLSANARRSRPASRNSVTGRSGLLSQRSNASRPRSVRT